jgi:SAM-dependent methyltransferase
MNALNELNGVFAEGRNVRLIEEGIYTVLDDATQVHHYDRRATAYDRIVGTWIYNAIMWGASPTDYSDFAREAIASSGEGKILDAGCGSMLFTAGAYLDTERAIIAFDQSLAMLRSARKRLIRLAGEMPNHVYLIQADLSDLPFCSLSFCTVICLNILHLFEDAPKLISELSALRTPEGGLYITSLVLNGRFIGDRYLNALHRAGEVVRPRSSVELTRMAEDILGKNINYSSKGSMTFITAPTMSARLPVHGSSTF